MGLSQELALGHCMALQPIKITQTLIKQARQLPHFPHQLRTLQFPQHFAINLFQGVIWVPTRVEKELPQNVPADLRCGIGAQDQVSVLVGLFPCVGSGTQKLHPTRLVQGVWVFIFGSQGVIVNYWPGGLLIRQDQKPQLIVTVRHILRRHIRGQNRQLQRPKGPARISAQILQPADHKLLIKNRFWQCDSQDSERAYGVCC